MRGKFLLAAIVAIIVIAVGGILFGTGSPVIEGIDIKGGGRIGTSEIQALSGFRVGQPFSATQQESAVEAIQRLSLVQHVSIRKKRSSLQGVRIEIDISEREPLGIVKLRDQSLHWVDREGFLLGAAHDNSFYPVMTGVVAEKTPEGTERISPAGAVESLRELFALPGEMQSQISEALFSGFYVELMTRDGVKVRVPATGLKRHLERYREILPQLQNEGFGAWSAVDMRIEGEATLR